MKPYETAASGALRAGYLPETSKSWKIKLRTKASGNGSIKKG